MNLPGEAGRPHIDQRYFTFQERLDEADLPLDDIDSAIDAGIAKAALPLQIIAHSVVPGIDRIAVAMTSDILDDYSIEGRDAFIGSVGLACVVASILEPRQLPELTEEDYIEPKKSFDSQWLTSMTDRYMLRSPRLLHVFESSHEYCDQSGSKIPHAYLGFFSAAMVIEMVSLYRTAYEVSDMLAAQEEKKMNIRFNTAIGRAFPGGQDGGCYNKAITQEVESALRRIAELPYE